MSSISSLGRHKSSEDGERRNLINCVESTACGCAPRADLRGALEGGSRAFGALRFEGTLEDAPLLCDLSPSLAEFGLGFEVSPAGLLVSLVPLVAAWRFLGGIFGERYITVEVQVTEKLSDGFFYWKE